MTQPLRLSLSKGQSLRAAILKALSRAEKFTSRDTTASPRWMTEALEQRTLLSGTLLHSSTVWQPNVSAPAITATVKHSNAKLVETKSAKRRGPRYSNPIVITSGGTYTGNWQSTDPNTPAVSIETDQPVTIINSNIKSAGTCIYVDDAANNVTIKYTIGLGENPEVNGDFVGRFLDAETWANIDVEHCDMENTAGMYLYNYVGDGTSDNTVTILNNTAENIDGRISNGNGGFQNVASDPNQYAQFLQMNGSQNPGNFVNANVGWNFIVNTQGQSRPEENINIFDTTGTPHSHFLIHNNYIYGAYPANGVDAATFTGGGIMLSDQGSAYIEADNNTIVNTGEEGMEISSGHDNSMNGNTVISDGLDANGNPESYSNVGMVIWNANNEGTFTNNSGSSNTIEWMGSDGNGGLTRNDTFIPDASSFTHANSPSGTVTPSMEASALTAFFKSGKKTHQIYGL